MSIFSEQDDNTCSVWSWQKQNIFKTKKRVLFPTPKKKKSNKQNKTKRKKTKPVLFPSQLYTGWLQSILRKIILGWKAYSGGLLSSVRQSPPSPFPSMMWSAAQSIAWLHHAKKIGFFFFFFFNSFGNKS